MNFSELFIRRPVTTVLVMVMILFFGIAAYRRLPVSDLPAVDFPTITVSASLPGASPETMASSVATPLEKQFSTIAGIDNMTSTSNLGSTQITIQFNLDRDIDAGAQDVQAMIAKTLRDLPPGIIPPSYQKVNPAEQPILFYAFTSPLMPLSKLNEYAETVMAQRISMVPGVAQVNVYGSQKYAVRVQLDPNSLAQRGIGIDEVASAISAQNVNLPTGVLMGPTKAYTLEADGQLENAASFKRMIVTYRNGAPVRLGDLGNVIDDVQNNRQAGWFIDTRGMILAIQKQPGSNPVQVADNVKATSEKLKAQVPASVTITPMIDRSVSIRESVHEVKFTLVLTLVLVVLVIFLFLRNVSATVIPSLALPISVIGTFAVMQLLGYSLNNLSLMALTIATGFVVDDAIVMIENIARYIEKGEAPMAAAIKGASQIGFTIISLTVSLIAVLIPLLFMGDVVGRLFREFAVTLAITILISAVVSLTLVPMMSGRWLQKEDERPQSRFGAAIQRGVDRVVAGYDRSLTWVLERQGLTLLVALATLALTVALYMLIPKELFPTQDTGQLQVRVQAEESVSFARMSTLQQQVAERLLQDPAVESLSSVVGVDGANNTMLHVGSMLINLKAGRSGSQDEIIDRLRQRAAQVPGTTIWLQPTQDLTIDAESGPTRYRLSLQAVDTATVRDWATRLGERLRESPKLRNIHTDAGASSSAAVVQIDRDSAARLGVSASAIDDALYSAFGQRIVSTIFTQSNQYRVILEAQQEGLASPEGLAQLPLRTSSGKTTPLASIARIEVRQVPLQVTHVEQYPATTVGFDTAPGVALGAAVDEITRAAKEIGMPSAVSMEFLGAANAYQASLTNQLWLILAAVICVYIVLGVLYESYIHPLTILSTLPTAGLGALLALRATDTEFTLIALLGLFLLIGIVMKNAILMIDFALERERRDGLTPDVAIFEAAKMRLRPILMTNFAALLGALPLVLATGEGVEMRRPLGLAIAGGLVVSQLLTLYTVPVVYLWLDRLRLRVKARFARGHSEAVPALQREATDAPGR